MKLKLIKTSNGSHTLYSPEFEEHYHSIHGAIQEAKHVFINAGFLHCKKNPISILDVGFGTGLNAFLTYLEAKNSGKRIHFHTIELYPLDISLVRKLNYIDILNPNEKYIFNKLHQVAWNKRKNINNNFTLHKILADLTTYSFNDAFDLVYFDPFAPDIQPELWDKKIFRKIYDSLNKEGIITTYSAKGEVKRTLTNIGYKVESLPGPLGKREIIRAIKL